MKKRLLIAVIVAIAVILPTVMLLAYVSRPGDSYTPATGEVGEPLTRASLLKRVNEERAKVGVAPLVENNLLNDSAQWKANDQAVNGYFGHYKPGESKANGLEKIQELERERGSICKQIGENLVNVKYGGVNGAIESWKTSKAHYDAMIDPKNTLTGFGFMTMNGTTQVVEHFCQQ